MTTPKLRLIILVMAITLAISGTRAVAQVVDQQYPLKTAWIWKLRLYVDWPGETFELTGREFVIGVLGKDVLGATLKQVESKTHNGMKVRVRRMQSMEQYEPCHILFISPVAADGRDGERPSDRLQAAIKKLDELRAAHVLLVSDGDGLASQGVVINLLFNRQTNKINAEVNMDAAARVGLQISPDFLALKEYVKIVREQPRTPEVN